MQISGITQAYLRSISGMYQAYLRHIIEASQVYLKHIKSKPLAYLRYKSGSQTYFTSISVISEANLNQTSGKCGAYIRSASIFYAYVAILRQL